MMKFLHASPAKLSPGTILELGERGYVCLASTVEQGLYWGYTLFGATSSRGNLQACSLYEVEVPDDIIVEDCRGHYTFEYRGVYKRAADVRPHAEDLDGEVVVRHRIVRVVKRLDISATFWGEWGKAHDRQVLAEMIAEAAL